MILNSTGSLQQKMDALQLIQIGDSCLAAPQVVSQFCKNMYFLAHG